MCTPNNNMPYAVILPVTTTHPIAHTCLCLTLKTYQFSHSLLLRYWFAATIVRVCLHLLSRETSSLFSLSLPLTLSFCSHTRMRWATFFNILEWSGTLIDLYHLNFVCICMFEVDRLFSVYFFDSNDLQLQKPKKSACNIVLKILLFEGFNPYFRSQLMEFRMKLSLASMILTLLYNSGRTWSNNWFLCLQNAFLAIIIMSRRWCCVIPSAAQIEFNARLIGNFELISDPLTCSRSVEFAVL